MPPFLLPPAFRIPNNHFSTEQLIIFISPLQSGLSVKRTISNRACNAARALWLNETICTSLCAAEPPPSSIHYATCGGDRIASTSTHSVWRLSVDGGSDRTASVVVGVVGCPLDLIMSLNTVLCAIYIYVHMVHVMPSYAPCHRVQRLLHDCARVNGHRVYDGRRAHAVFLNWTPISHAAHTSTRGLRYFDDLLSAHNDKQWLISL